VAEAQCQGCEAEAVQGSASEFDSGQVGLPYSTMCLC
jgi:hypothetical protein